MKLFVVGTPIGNLSDITFRALETLKSVDLICAEDTRVTAKLLAHYEIATSLLSYRDEVHEKVARKIIGMLKNGKSVALVTDAGTPGISDPGARLVLQAQEAGIPVEVIPGPSAVTAALSVAGVSSDNFTFFGFPPPKKKRKTFFEQVCACSYTAVLFESPHRLARTLEDLAHICGEDRVVIVCKELTKIHEAVIKGTPAEILQRLSEMHHSYRMLGEYVIVIPSVKRR